MTVSTRDSHFNGKAALGLVVSHWGFQLTLRLNVCVAWAGL